eukprot:1175978-Prorocentrum_minimum.AAC.1
MHYLKDSVSLIRMHTVSRPGMCQFVPASPWSSERSTFSAVDRSSLVLKPNPKCENKFDVSTCSSLTYTAHREPISAPTASRHCVPRETRHVMSCQATR